MKNYTDLTIGEIKALTEEQIEAYAEKVKRLAIEKIRADIDKLKRIDKDLSD